MTAQLPWQKDFIRLLGLELRKVRTNKKLSQTKAVDSSGISRHWLLKIENGAKNPSIYFLYYYMVSNGFDLLDVLKHVDERFSFQKEKIKKSNYFK